MNSKIMDCDLLVLGAGGAGLVAGVKAADLTGKKVIILEKSKKPGGATYFAGGMGESGPIKDSTWQKNAGHPVSEIQDISGQWFDWLVSKGDAETFFKVSKPGETGRGAGIGTLMARTEKYKDLPDPSIGPGKMGSWVVDKLTDCCKKQGIQLLTETRARKFVTDDKGRLTGVIADTTDGLLLVTCKACVVAAGGYGANMDLLKKYYPKQFNNKTIHSLCPPADTGDCILAAEEIGAYIDPTIRSLDFPGGFFGDGLGRHPWTFTLQNLLGNGKAVVMNLDGKRWKNEAGMMGGDISEQRDGIGFAIFDSEILESAGSGGMGGMGGPGGPSGPGGGSSDSPEAKAQARWREDFEYEIAIDEEGASGYHAKKAYTLVELALKIKIDPRTFVDTIDRYNKFCETGKDLEFGKPESTLKKINKPPYYALFGHRWSQCTKGRNGIAVNSKFQVLNPKGEAMPGLYAAGDGCTIFGGFVIGMPNGGNGTWTAEQTATRTALSKDVAQVYTAASSAGAQGGVPGGMPGSGPGTGAPGAGGPGDQGGQGAGARGASAPGGQGAMPMMGGSAQNNDILKGVSSPCGGLGPAFLSGYCAGVYVAAYLKNL
jgi:fumarate reductase flavoprotein subunit